MGKIRFLFLLVIIVALLFISYLFPTFAADETASEIMKGISSSFSLPLRDLLKKKYPSEWRNLFHGFSGSFSFCYPLKQLPPKNAIGGGTQGERRANMTLSATITYNPISYWFFSVTFYRYLHPQYQAPWDPDFSYTFGYNDWHPYTFSLVYSNYGGNRLFPKKGEKFTTFEEGTWSLGWKFVLPQKIERLFTVHKTGGIGCSIHYNYTPRYFDLATLSNKHSKQSLSLNIKYTIYKWWYANVTLYWYPHPDQQQPWDPDFTYGFGYFDWHPGTISIQYNNYSGNRFPWKKRAPNTGRFKDGSICIFWSWKW